MKFTTAALASSLVSAVAAQSSAYDLLQYAELLISKPCIAAVSSLVASNATFGQCLQVQNLLPILASNQSLIAPIETYVESVCATPACSNATITNATQSILTGCSSDLTKFGISSDIVEIVFGAYSTAREVACLSTNSSSFFTNSSSVYPNATVFNSTAATGNSTLCPISFLKSIETFIGAPLTNTYIDTLLLGGNATAVQSFVGVAQNTTLIKEFACNDCISTAFDIVLANYPILDNLTVPLPNTLLNSYTNSTSYAASGVTNLTVPTFYEGICHIDVGANSSIPVSINETAYNTTFKSIYQKNATSSSLTKRSIKIGRLN